MIDMNRLRELTAELGFMRPGGDGAARHRDARMKSRTALLYFSGPCQNIA
jgi:hypothetical protein